MAKTVIALYDDIGDAHRAIQALRDEGFTSSDISLMSHDADNRYSRYLQQKMDEKGIVGGTADAARNLDAHSKVGEGASAGAGIGAAIGALGGLLVGLGAFAIPGVGPVVAAGPLAATLIGAAGGAAAGGIIGALIGAGIPEEEAHMYAEGLHRGGSIVAVRASDDRADRAADVLGRFNPVDVEQRASMWRESGWTGRYDANTQPYNLDRISKEYSSYSSGQTRTSGNTFRPRSYNYASTGAAAGMGAAAAMGAGTYATTGSTQTTGSGGLSTSGMGASSSQSNLGTGGMGASGGQKGAVEFQPDFQVNQGQSAGATNPMGGGTSTTMGGAGTGVGSSASSGLGQDYYSRYEQDFRQHFAQSSSMGGRYEDYSDAYRFGTDLGRDNRYARMEWNDLEAEAAKRWAQNPNASAWDKVKNYIRYGWHKTKAEAIDATIPGNRV